MSNYYTQRKKAKNTIRILYHKGVCFEEIAYTLAMDHGFSKKFVKETIMEIEDMIELQKKRNEAKNG